MATRRLAIVLSTVIVLGLGDATTTARAATTTSLRGTFALADRQYWTTAAAASCVGTGLYSDVGEGTALKVLDERRAVIARTTLGAGHRTNEACVFGFALELTPARAYTFEVGSLRDGGLIYRESWDAEGLEDLHGQLVFGLGNEMVLTPRRPKPGSALSVHFPAGALRGLGYRIDQRSQGRWSPVYWLTSDRLDRAPTAVPASEGLTVEDIAVIGPQPDGLVLPDDIAPGRYRLCADRTAHCTRLDVVSRRS
jgi:hypothetical protein